MSSDSQELDKLIEEHNKRRRWLLPLGVFLMLLPILAVFLYFIYYQQDINLKGQKIDAKNDTIMIYQQRVDTIMKLVVGDPDTIVATRGGPDLYTILLQRLDSLAKCCKGTRSGTTVNIDGCEELVNTLNDKIRSLEDELSECKEGKPGDSKEVIKIVSSHCDDPPWHELYNLRDQWMDHEANLAEIESLRALLEEKKSIIRELEAKLE